MSWLSRTIKRNTNTLASITKIGGIAAAPLTGGSSLAIGTSLSGFFSNRKNNANVSDLPPEKISTLQTVSTNNFLSRYWYLIVGGMFVGGYILLKGRK